MTMLITGSEGLIGANLIPRLFARGIAVRPFDIRRSTAEDIRVPSAVEAALGEGDVTGVVHLAAVSRVVWAQKDPERCEATNVRALKSLLKQCAAQPRPPWVIFASSREVYGAQKQLLVPESAPYDPINTYGRSKVEGERLVEEARDAGLLANTCRFSSVYGWPHDHADRVAMAFARAAAYGGSIAIEGASNVFDFTFVDDVVDGLLSLIEVTQSGMGLPPVHFVSGVGTSLGELADIARDLARQRVTLREAPARTFDVGHFVGDPTRAAALLGWRARTDVRTGLGMLVARMCGHDAPRVQLVSSVPIFTATGNVQAVAGSAR